MSIVSCRQRNLATFVTFFFPRQFVFWLSGHLIPGIFSFFLTDKNISVWNVATALFLHFAYNLDIFWSCGKITVDFCSIKCILRQIFRSFKQYVTLNSRDNLVFKLSWLLIFTSFPTFATSSSSTFSSFKVITLKVSYFIQSDLHDKYFYEDSFKTTLLLEECIVVRQICTNENQL